MIEKFSKWFVATPLRRELFGLIVSLIAITVIILSTEGLQ